MNTETTETETAEITSPTTPAAVATTPSLPPVKSDSEVSAFPLSPSFPSRASVENSPAVHSASSIENQKSKIENLLYDLTSILMRFVVLPPYAAETLALWILHTYAFDLRDISTYIGIESPGKGCGKTTLLRVLGKLVRKPVSTANVSPSALFRVIEEPINRSTSSCRVKPCDQGEICL